MLVDADAAVDPADVRAAVAGVRDVPVVVRPVRGASLTEVWAAPLLLVRPDQHVAWRGSDPADLGPAVARAAGGGQDR
jgi:hypothetical protein